MSDLIAIVYAMGYETMFLFKQFSKKQRHSHPNKNSHQLPSVGARLFLWSLIMASWAEDVEECGQIAQAWSCQNHLCSEGLPGNQHWLFCQTFYEYLIDMTWVPGNPPASFHSKKKRRRWRGEGKRRSGEEEEGREPSCLDNIEPSNPPLHLACWAIDGKHLCDLISFQALNPDSFP